MNVPDIVRRLESLGSAENVAGMARFGITAAKAFGVPAPELKAVAKDVKKAGLERHSTALELWQTGIHDARIVAYLIDDPKLVNAEQMEAWAGDFENWAIVDGTCGHLFCRTPAAYAKAFEWSERDAEFIKRAGIVLMAWLAVHDKKADDSKIEQFLPVLEKHAGDDRNFVKKAVNWSLRQIGKRSLQLNERAIETAGRIQLQNTKPARWIAADALRELRSEAVRARLIGKKLKAG